MIAIPDPDTPLRMVLGTVLALAFLRWIVWLVDRREPRDPHPDRMSESWRADRRFWIR
jgi:hypothetical protein